jgi:hypothetical protein
MRGGPVVRFVCAVAACAATGAAFALATAAGHRAAGRATSGILIPSDPREILPLSGGTVHSHNWSGYAVRSKNHSISGVSGTFVVPAATNAPVGIAVTWAGIGGFKRHDLIQAGTIEESRFFGRKYFAWYELLPNPLTRLHGCSGDSTCRVSPGNHIIINVHQVGSGSWSISVADQGHWSWAKQFHYTSSRSSAEWILEAPSIGTGQPPLAKVGTVRFGPTSKYTTGGSSHTISQGHPIKIILTGQATPSALGSDGQSFNDCSYKSSCPRP